ncbi:MucR family transcriptional regulator [Methylobacterium oryzisoli]|uniref:MucR family transcriptional regulator n=1 Tax=Methylobacterium oryzisoli TaxID=3385502 RepID=UPI0038918936
MSKVDTTPGSSETIGLAAGIVTAYVSNNVVQPAQLSPFIADVHAALARLGKPAAPEPAKLTPPVPIKRTVTQDAIISLENGKPYKTLGRHLISRGLTPDQYRQKWGLPADYPMVAANYAARRSELAKSLGLGRTNRRGLRGGGHPSG